MPSADEQGEINRIRNELVSRFGRAYRTDYGWAAAALGKNKPGLSDLEEAVATSHWRPYVDISNHGVHAGARALFWDLGMPSEMQVGPAGPSNMGMADPGQSTALSLSLALTAFLVERPDIDSLADASALQALASWTQETFVGQGRAHEASVDQERAIRAARKRARSGRLRFKVVAQPIGRGWWGWIDDLRVAVHANRLRDIEAVARTEMVDALGVSADAVDVVVERAERPP